MKRLSALALPAVLAGSESLLQGLLTAASLLLVGAFAAPLLRFLRTVSPGQRLAAALLLGGVATTAGALALRAVSLEAYHASASALALVALVPAGLQAAGNARALARIAGLAILLGALREGLGHGSLLQQHGWLAGWALPWHWPLLALPPLSLLLLGLALAARRHLSPKQDDR